MSTTAPDATGTSDLVSRIQMTSKLLCRDLECMDDMSLSKEFGGKARTGFDLAYEVAAVNRIVAAALRGETSEGEPPTGWMRAPQALRSRDAVLQELRESVEDVSTELRRATPAALEKVVETPLGALSVDAFANILPGHIMYHSGQLNYIQTLCGDDQFHWG